MVSLDHDLEHWVHDAETSDVFRGEVGYDLDLDLTRQNDEAVHGLVDGLADGLVHRLAAGLL